MLVSNDSDAATQAELSASPGSEDMVLVHVGRGVGCGIVTGGRRVSGAHHAAGEIGHVTVGTDGGEDCPCGKRGCLETWLSIPRLRAALDSPDGHEVVEAGGERLGVALAPIVAALDLSEVVLAGPEELLAPVLPVLERTLAQRLLADPDAPLSVRLAASPEDIVLRGAAAVVLWDQTRGRLDPAPNPHHLPPPPAPPTTCTTSETSTAPPHHHHHRTSVHTPGPTGPTARKEDRMIRRLPIVALTSAALVLTACASGGDTSDTPAATSSTSNAGKTITLWLAGGDTPDELRTYLSDTFKAKTGATLTIEEQAWPDLVTKLTTALPDAENTPDVVELGNTQSPTFTNVGAFLDISDQYDALGGDKLLQSFVEAGSVDGKKYALPYYFGSRYMFHAQGRLEGGRRRTRRPPSTSSTRPSPRSPQDEPARHQELLRLLHRRPGLAQRHLLDLRQRRRPGQEGERAVGLHPLRPELPQGPPAAPGDPEDREQRPGRRQGPDPLALHQRRRRHHRRRRQGHRQDHPLRRHDHGAGLGALVDR